MCSFNWHIDCIHHLYQSNYMDNEITIVLAIIGAVTGVSGVFLGLINTWYNINDKKIRVKVRFVANCKTPRETAPYISTSNKLTSELEPYGYSIEVINLSSFPINIQEVGFSFSPFWIRNIERGAISPHALTDCLIPCKLESRERASFNFSPSLINSSFEKIYSTYVKTSCGQYFKGSTPALKSLVKQIYIHN